MGLFKKVAKKAEKVAEKVEKAAETVVETVTEAVNEAVDAVEEAIAEKKEELAEKAAEADVAAEEIEEAPAEADAVEADEQEAHAEETTEEAVDEASEEIVEEEVVEVVPAEDACEAAPCEAAEVCDFEGKLHVIDHPLVQHKLTIMRDKNTGAKDFRELLDEIAMLVGYEVTRDLPLCDVEIETPLTPMLGKAIEGKKLAIVPILRAGLGMVDGLLRLVPAAKVGHIGLYRHPETHMPVEYYCKLPDDIENRLVIITDPMLATGGSAVEAIRMLKLKGCTDIRLMCLVAAPEGVDAIHSVHPDVEIFTAALDERLNEKAYILPGLGDAGDRLFGTY
ncbi:MAG: uracil phosphoribosyltransferase [Clostridia bacterium]|nr:uracil phosphoribosyltransferase [Clostridia bacterium]